MAVATGTALLIGAGVSAAAQAYGAKKSGDATNKQLDANTQALDYQRSEREREQRQWAQTWDNWNRRRSALMDRYGLARLDDTNPFHDPDPGFSNPAPGSVMADLRDRMNSGAGIPNAAVAQGRAPVGSNLADLAQAPADLGELYDPYGLREWEVGNA